MFFHDFNFFFSQAVEVVNEFVDLFIGGVDLPLDSRFVGGDFDGSQFLVQSQHLLNKFYHFVMQCFFSRVRKGDSPNWNLLQVWGAKLVICAREDGTMTNCIEAKQT